MATRLIIARHGNTFGPGDVVTRVGGRTDLPLVASGIEQGRRLGAHLKEKGLLPDVVFTADLLRTRQTAAEALKAAGIAPPCETLAIFNEVDYGPDENKPEAEVVARVGEAALKAWDEEGIVPEGWAIDVAEIIEGWLAFGQRVRQDFADRTVMVVTSNGIARFAPHLTGDFGAFRRTHKLKLSTGAYALFEARDSGVWSVEGWNVKPV
jgi:probable phosphoglycerate mutase